MAEKLKTVTAIAEDSNKQRHYFMGRVERFDDEIRKLKALDFLLSGNSNEDLNELSWLVSPIVENLIQIQEELSEFFNKSGVVFAFPAKSGATIIQGESSHE